MGLLEDPSPYLVVFSEWTIRAVMLLVVPNRRSPEAAKGWLLLIFFLPWVGLALYLLLGTNRTPRWKKKRVQELGDIHGVMAEKMLTQLQPFHAKLPERLNETATLTSNLGEFHAVSFNQTQLIADYDEAINRLIDDINTAKHHVHLLYYIFAHDSVGRRVIHALREAGKRGVKCRVMFDGIGSRGWTGKLLSCFRKAGVDTKVISSLPFANEGVFRFDLRNHRKIAIIDGRVAYAGSQNIVKKATDPKVSFVELVARLEGPVVPQLQAAFLSDWFLETGNFVDGKSAFPEPQKKGSSIAQVLPSGPDFPSINVENVVTTLIYGAKKQITITNPYFVPSESILVAIDCAANRGVDVKLIVSAITDSRLVKLAQCSYYDQLLTSGVNIHVYRHNFLHAKHISIDEDIAFMGSSNIDIRSFRLNSEVTVIFYDATTVSALRDQEMKYLQDSDQLELEQWRKRSRSTQILENVARLASPLL